MSDASRKAMVAMFPPADNVDKAKALADLGLNPSASAAVVSAAYLKSTYGEQDLGSLVKSLGAATAKVQRGDLSGCEAMLYGQAQALQDVFVALARRATNQDGLKQWETVLRLALKAQNQSRMTLETLATVKNPPVVFAKQANFAAGHQQVNNDIAASSRAREIESEQSKLLEINHGERLDTGTTGTAIGGNPALETVGSLNGAAIARG